MVAEGAGVNRRRLLLGATVELVESSRARCRADASSEPMTLK
jgi:hypothetical protein